MATGRGGVGAAARRGAGGLPLLRADGRGGPRPGRRGMARTG
jgi:hypothetical protein